MSRPAAGAARRRRSAESPRPCRSGRSCARRAAAFRRGRRWSCRQLPPARRARQSRCQASGGAVSHTVSVRYSSERRDSGKLEVVTSFALKSLFSRKLRTALTAIAIVLGVAMISGTYVLTDSISGAFDAIFTQTYQGTDAVISGKSAFDLSTNGLTTAPPFAESLLPKVEALPDVRAAIGGVAGEAHLIGTNGKAIVFGGAPNLGFSVDPTHPTFNSLTLVSGRWPRNGEVVIDESTAGKKDIAVGQRLGIQAEGPVRQFRVSGLVKFGSVSTIGGATLAGFDLSTAQDLFAK